MSRICVKVASLRKADQDSNFEKWLKAPDTVYCGRKGRIFVNKVYFGYEGSKWENVFAVKKYGLEKCLELFREDITEKIKKDPIHYNLDELRGKQLGCWCDYGSKCHVDILLDLLK